MIIRTEPKLSHSRIRTARTTGCDHQAGQRSLHSKPDAYGSFVEDTNQETQKEFYAKLARVLLKSPRKVSGS